MAAVRLKIASLAREPLFWILCGVVVLHAVGIGWGLPADDAWDDDGVAPRDFLVGVVQTFTPGKYYTYPPLHVALLALVTSPVWIAALLRAPSLSPAVLVHTFLTVPTMTALALIARAVTVIMSAGIVFALGRVGQELRGRRAGLFVAAVVSVDAIFAYYSHTSNLDVPYCFWTSFALLEVVRAIVRLEPRRLHVAAVLGALAITTKDQAAALFALGAPLTIACWFAFDEWPRKNLRQVTKDVSIAAAILIGLTLLIDGALVNPAGFRARVGFLLGSASRDYAGYPNNLEGRIAVLRNSFFAFPRFYPWPFAGLAVVGLGLAAAGPARTRAAALAPALFAASFLVLFNVMALRTDDRFLLPQSLLAGVYAGICLAACVDRASKTLAPVAALGAVGLLAWALFKCAAVDVNLVWDPRYGAEAWLRTHVRSGDLLEVYGNQVYLPRLPAQARVLRVDRRPIDQRNPLTGAVEIDAPFADVEKRRPRWIVVTDTEIWQYLVSPDELRRSGRILASDQRAARENIEARTYFRELVAGRRGYSLAYLSKWDSEIWPRIQIHGSTGEEIRILERQAQP